MAKGTAAPTATDKAAARAKASGGSENPRLSARRESVATSKRRRRRIIALVIVGLIALGIGAWLLLHSALFSAKTITVHGAAHASSAQVIEAAGLASHPPLISISTETAARGVETLPWVATASIQLHWPAAVTITVVERVPVATVSVGGHVALVDASGRILSLTPTVPQGTGAVAMMAPGLAIGQVGTWVGPAGDPALHVAATLPPAFKGQVARVVGHRDGTVTLVMTSPITIQLGTPAQLDQKYRDIASIIAGATLHPGDVVDVSVPQASTVTGP